MVFTRESFSVQFQLNRIAKGAERESVPQLFNLKEVVFEILDEQLV